MQVHVCTVYHNTTQAWLPNTQRNVRNATSLRILFSRSRRKRRNGQNARIEAVPIRVFVALRALRALRWRWKPRLTLGWRLFITTRPSLAGSGRTSGDCSPSFRRRHSTLEARGSRQRHYTCRYALHFHCNCASTCTVK